MRIGVHQTAWYPSVRLYENAARRSFMILRH
jgi:hypothetical protein